MCFFGWQIRSYCVKRPAYWVLLKLSLKIVEQCCIRQTKYNYISKLKIENSNFPRWMEYQRNLHKIGNVLKKCIEKEVVFTNPEMNNEWNVDFLQNSFLDIQHLHSGDNCLGRTIIFFLQREALPSYLYQCPPYSQMLTLRYLKKNIWMQDRFVGNELCYYRGGYAYISLCFMQKYWLKSFENWLLLV